MNFLYFVDDFLKCPKLTDGGIFSRLVLIWEKRHLMMPAQDPV